MFDWFLTDDLPTHLAISFPARCPEPSRQSSLAILNRLGIRPIVTSDAPGLIVARTVAMLVNEAADAVQQQVCDVSAADTAMKLGVNYPAGPFEWLDKCGVSDIVRLLDNLHRLTRSERYRVSPWMLERYWIDGTLTQQKERTGNTVSA